VTLRDFLCHRSGVSRNDLAWLAQPELAQVELVHRMRHLEPIAAFRTKFQYLNWGYLLLGYLAGVVTGSLPAQRRRAGRHARDL
jgi:CubicO group peptidase (beta-lactamase class C family)